MMKSVENDENGNVAVEKSVDGEWLSSNKTELIDQQ